MSFELHIPRSTFNQIIEQAWREKPLECCGFLAGLVGPDNKAMVLGGFPLLNSARSPILFEAEPRSIFDATRAIDRQSWQLLAIYHSHPTTDPIPSRTDLERSYDPDVMSVIISLRKEPEVVRAWWLLGDSYQEGKWSIVEPHETEDAG